MAKCGLFSRRTHVDATWHARPCGSATQAHAVPTWRNVTLIYIYHIYLGYNTYKSSDYRKIIIISLISSHILNPPPSFNLIRVGLSSTRHFKFQVTWPKEEPWIERRNDRRAWIAWTRGPPNLIRCTCLKGGVIKALIESRATHPDRQIAIRGAKTHVFYNASH